MSVQTVVFTTHFEIRMSDSFKNSFSPGHSRSMEIGQGERAEKEIW